MQQKFNIIKREYDDYYLSLLKKGQLPLKTTEKGFWGIAIADEIFQLFQKIKLEKYKNFLDIGSGDGKVISIASLFTKASGIEIDKELVDDSKKISKRLKLKTNIINNDFLKHDFSGYDLIFLYPDHHSIELDNKLKKELKGKLIVYGSYFHPQSLKKEKTFNIGSWVTIYSNE